jgi:hypothetical protein
MARFTKKAVIEVPRKVVFNGPKGSKFSFSTEGINIVHPCGIEVEVTEEVYQAVRAYIKA